MAFSLPARLPLIAVALLAPLLAACANPVGDAINRGIGALDIEAGSSVDEGQFGEATSYNERVLKAYGSDAQLMIDLQKKFEREVPTTIHFAFNSAELDEEAKAVLRRQADWIRQYPEVRFKVYGHTDKVGSPAYNKRLGLRRAKAAVRYLISQGVNPKQVAAVVSYGESRPIVHSEGPERANRRTVTEVSGLMPNARSIPTDARYATLVYRTYTEGGAFVRDSFKAAQ